MHVTILLVRRQKSVTEFLGRSAGGANGLPKYSHEQKCREKIWHHRSRVPFQLVVERARGEPCHRDVLENATVFRFAGNDQELLLPLAAARVLPLRVDGHEVHQLDGRHADDGLVVGHQRPAEEDRKCVHVE